MPEIDLGPVNPPEPARVGPEPDPPPASDPDQLSFGDEPDGGDERERADAGWAERLRWWPARWRRPVPRGVVAAVSAVVAGAAVAVYLDRPAEEALPPPEPARVLSPESWLDVSDDGGFQIPTGAIETEGPRWEAAVAQHPAEALLVLPLALYRPQLVGLPPDSYLVQASCELASVPESVPEPVRYGVNLREDAAFTVTTPELRCDGAVRTVDERLAVPDYQAFFVDYYFLAGEFDGTEGEDPYLLLEQAEPVVVLSFQPA